MMHYYRRGAGGSALETRDGAIVKRNRGRPTVGDNTPSAEDSRACSRCVDASRHCCTRHCREGTGREWVRKGTASRVNGDYSSAPAAAVPFLKIGPPFPPRCPVLAREPAAEPFADVGAVKETTLARPLPLLLPSDSTDTVKPSSSASSENCVGGVHVGKKKGE
jgi:hypothetical protein